MEIKVCALLLRCVGALGGAWGEKKLSDNGFSGFGE